MVVRLFILTWILPVIFFVGDVGKVGEAGQVRLPPYRLILLGTFIPLVVAWASGRAGRPRAPDFLILLSALWGVVALLVNHGPSIALQTAATLFLETFGSYLLARCLIRDRSSFEAMVRMLFFTVVLILPFILVETITGRPILLDLFGNTFMVIPQVKQSPRWGLVRAQGPFEHPILLGLFCSSVFGLASYVMAKKGSNQRQGLIALAVGCLLSAGAILSEPFEHPILLGAFCASVFGLASYVMAKKGSNGRFLRQGLIALAVGCSLSAGAILSLATQLGLMSWAHFTRGVKGRWKILGLSIAFGYFAISLLSHQTVFEHFSNLFTFDRENAYYRILIWNFGSQEVVRHPFFGIGLNDWIRPSWMISKSVDNFWLLTAMRYGLPAVSFLIAAIFLIFIRLGRIRSVDDDVKACRTGLLISLSGVIISLSTVDIWNASYCLFFFLLGSGLWMLGEATPQFARAGRTRVGRSAAVETPLGVDSEAADVS
jgi:hypothetical protein